MVNEIMNIISGVLAMAIIGSPFILLVLKLKKVEDREKNVKKVFEEIEMGKNIKITKELSLIWKKKFEKLIVDDSNETIYYIKINKKNFKDREILEIKYDSIIKFNVIWDTHTESIQDLATFRERRVYEEKVHRQGIQLTLDDIKNPKVDILFDDPSNGSGFKLKGYIEEWGAVFEVILNRMNKKEAENLIS